MATQDQYGRVFPNKTEKDYKELSKKELLHIYRYLEDIYGIPKNELKKYLFLKKKDGVWVTTKKSYNLYPFRKQGLRINTIGFRAIRNSFQTTPKITTNFAQMLSKHISKNIRFVDRKELESFVKGYTLEKKDEELKNYCVIKYKEFVVGVGQVQNDTIKNQIPKGRVLVNFENK